MDPHARAATMIHQIVKAFDGPPPSANPSRIKMWERAQFIAYTHLIEMDRAGAAACVLVSSLIKLIPLAHTVKATKSQESLIEYFASSIGLKKSFERECDDADRLIELLGLDPAACRTACGNINIPKIKTMLSERGPVGQSPKCPKCGSESYIHREATFAYPECYSCSECGHAE